MSKLETANRSAIVGTIMLVWSLASWAGIGHADGFGDDNRGCAIDEPCFNRISQSGDRITFQFTEITGWDFYNVRYVQNGQDKQVENRSGSFTFTNTQPNRTYKIRVQGCNSHTLARSTCSAWVEASFTTAGPPAPAAPPQPPGKPVGKSMGRIKVGSSTLGPPRPICESAQDARARSSPVAPDLEAQCRAAGGQDAYYHLQVKQGGKYLDVVNCSDQVALNPSSTYAGGACQLWRFVPAGDGWNRLQLKARRNIAKYLDVVNCSDQVALNPSSTYAGGACQLWRFVPAGNGWNRLQLKAGGKYLDASYCSDKLVLNGRSSYADGACQLWRLH